MPPHATRILPVLAVITLHVSSATAQEDLLAFPGAEGFGRFAKGGRGGDVYHVTNLNDSGPGSLREAIRTKQADRPRTVVFDVGGTIQLRKELRIDSVAGLTLAGQTAPGGGVTVRDHGVSFRKCSDIIVRYMRFRLGDETRTSSDVLNFGPEAGTCRNIILDHVTATWGIDAIMDVYAADRFTMQWCLFGEALHDSTHDEGKPHAMLMSFRKITGSVSIHHNLFFSSRDRHPSLGGSFSPWGEATAVFDFRNNTIYNWEGACNLSTGRFSIIGNYWRPGPNSKPWAKDFPIQPKAVTDDVTTGFFSGNVFENQSDWTANNYDAFKWGVRSKEYPGRVTRERFIQPSDVVPFVDRPATQPAEQASSLVLAHAGASQPRDAADERVIAEIKARTHRRIDSQKDVGGWPKLPTGSAPKDTDQDGMPDTWEHSHQLDPRNPNDGNAIQSTGFTNLETYLNSLVPPN